MRCFKENPEDSTHTHTHTHTHTPGLILHTNTGTDITNWLYVHTHSLHWEVKGRHTEELFQLSTESYSRHTHTHTLYKYTHTHTHTLYRGQRSSECKIRNNWFDSGVKWVAVVLPGNKTSVAPSTVSDSHTGDQTTGDCSHTHTHHVDMCGEVKLALTHSVLFSQNKAVLCYYQVKIILWAVY